MKITTLIGMNEYLTERLLLTEEEAAELLGIEPHTLGKYRRAGNGPPYVQLSKGKKRQLVRYRRLDIEEWIEQKRKNYETL